MGEGERGIEKKHGVRTFVRSAGTGYIYRRKATRGWSTICRLRQEEAEVHKTCLRRREKPFRLCQGLCDQGADPLRPYKRPRALEPISEKFWGTPGDETAVKKCGKIPAATDRWADTRFVGQYNAQQYDGTRDSIRNPVGPELSTKKSTLTAMLSRSFGSSGSS